ncbi:hypothetical protein EXN66_Car005995 [Channa argus]|uniref:Uncharacterized protein n=1 Tax=Channa argus TaxID=215402 RepID=A0A6G1PJF4_CHAAH|nr:hypothetical protein EXN66_Car005995 [Channa argus]
MESISRIVCLSAALNPVRELCLSAWTWPSTRLRSLPACMVPELAVGHITERALNKVQTEVRRLDEGKHFLEDQQASTALPSFKGQTINLACRKVKWRTGDAVSHAQVLVADRTWTADANVLNY